MIFCATRSISLAARFTSLSVFFAGFSSPTLSSQSSGPLAALQCPSMTMNQQFPFVPIVKPSSALFRGCRYTTQLHPWRHHWPPHSNPKRPTFQRGSPPPAPTPDSPPGCSSPTSGTFCDCPLTFISDVEPTTSPACPTGYVSLECIHFFQPPLHHCPTQALASLAWTNWSLPPTRAPSNQFPCSSQSCL